MTGIETIAIFGSVENENKTQPLDITYLPSTQTEPLHNISDRGPIDAVWYESEEFLAQP